jgi:short-subunit dehydrogenase
MSIAIIGSSSGLGFEIYNLLKKNNKVFSFSSSNKKKFIKIDLHKLNLKKFRNDLKRIGQINEIYYVSNYSFHKKIKNYEDKDFQKLSQFNIINFCKIIKILVEKNKSLKINMILSHICFMYNYGFVFYRSHKLFQKVFLQSLQIEYPKLEINFYYPGAINTDFVKNNNYKGKSVFKVISVQKVASMIIKKKKFINFHDQIFYFFYKVLPEKFIFKFYSLVLKFLNK